MKETRKNKNKKLFFNLQKTRSIKACITFAALFVVNKVRYKPSTTNFKLHNIDPFC